MRNGFLSIAGLLVAWQALFQFAGTHALSPPIDTMLFLLHLLETATFWGHLLETGRAFAAALALSVLLGLGIGLPFGLNKLAAEIAEPLLVSAYAVPKIVLFPIVLLIFGIGLPAKIAFGAIHGVIPVAIFAMAGVRQVGPVYLRTARVLRLSRTATLCCIVWPAALPEIFSGLRIGFSLTLIGTLLGEMFGSQKGLGYLLMNAIGLQNVPVIMAVTLLLAIFAATLSTVLLAWDRRLHRG
ncbi:MAG: ABC transporter permease subunit [Rhodospirillales bacterium]